MAKRCEIAFSSKYVTFLVMKIFKYNIPKERHCTHDGGQAHTNRKYTM